MFWYGEYVFDKSSQGGLKKDKIHNHLIGKYASIYVQMYVYVFSLHVCLGRLHVADELQA